MFSLINSIKDDILGKNIEGLSIYAQCFQVHLCFMVTRYAGYLFSFPGTQSKMHRSLIEDQLEDRTMGKSCGCCQLGTCSHWVKTNESRGGDYPPVV